MRAKLLIVALAVVLPGCEALKELEQAQAGSGQAAAASEMSFPSCQGKVAARWSVAINGEPSFIANFATRQHETRTLPLVVENMTATEVKFGYVGDPVTSANMSKVKAAVGQLPSGVCGMQGKFQAFPESAERSVVMVPLDGTRLTQ